MARLAEICVGVVVALSGCSAEGELGEQRGVLLGAAANDGTAESVSNLETLEEQVGRRFRLDRIYRRWNNAMPSERERRSIAAGRIPVVSFNGRQEPDEPVSWASVARGDHDGYLVEIASGYRELGARVLLLYHQSPDDEPERYGSSEEYRAAYRRVVTIFRDNAADNVVWIWSMRSPSFATWADDFYPGDDVVDWIGANAFNYGTEAGGSRWISLRGLLSDFVSWSHPTGKPLILAEWACTEDERAPGRKAAWLDESRVTLREYPQIRGAIYFHQPGALSAADSSPASLDAFRRLAQDPYLR